MNPSVLVVDDEQMFRLLAETALSSEGFEVRTAPTLAKAKAEVERSAPDIIVLDRRLPDGDGIHYLRDLRTEGGSAPIVIVVTAYGDVENAVEALRAGAADYLTKPVQATDLVIKLRKVLEARGLRDRLALKRRGAGGVSVPRVEPNSPSERAVYERLRSIAQSPLTPVILVGPSGVGKQYAAELLHALTYGKTDQDAPFVDLNCAALPSELVESELFGHEKGAFTDAKNTRRGLIEMADGGTLFLDEVTEMPLPTQAKLLKFLDNMRLRRVGGDREITVSLRVVAATNRDIQDQVKAGRFREDLYHRLSVFLIAIPPLAQRREDIPDLAAAFVSFFAERIKKRITGLTPGAVKTLQGYGYPGNVRELRNIIERAVILSSGPEVSERDIVLPERELSRGADGPFFSIRVGDGEGPPALEAVERQYVARVLEHFEGKRMQAAQALGISYPTFLKRLRELGID
jgi:two-component system, NtrC family, response regulator AtoC